MSTGVRVARKPKPLEELAAELRGQSAELRVLSADLGKPDVLGRSFGPIGISSTDCR